MPWLTPSRAIGWPGTRHRPGRAGLRLLKLGPSMRLLHNVSLRHEGRGYKRGNELFDAAEHAWNAIHGLSVTAHYLALRERTGQPKADQESPQQGGS